MFNVSGSSSERGRRWFFVAAAVMLVGVLTWAMDASFIRDANIETTATDPSDQLHTDARISEQSPVSAPVANASLPNKTPSPRVPGVVMAGQGQEQTATWRAGLGGALNTDLPGLRPAQVDRLGRILQLDAVGMERLRSLNETEVSAAASAGERRGAIRRRLAQMGEVVRTSPAYLENPSAFERRPLIKLLLQAEATLPAKQAAP